ncbi:MotA/TolQ/ExbB proton channel family protein [Flammeovirga agarivorans]|uniref:MotA/TolQ/ExbB proton channel family protein n=1 Tax=Flammeovirga agarivorans TaxID=2726742 RepID=A0A7X8SMH2_9BACT|nr:MotA/TolQ/ExbB proton channel family protein [Flammeovirga agarivorans]NLR92903.1 MotA/TolQ/ExbB proton channel family protein [Flammeovirga agarivorans]
MSISELYYWGGLEFMNTISIIGIIMVVFMVMRIMKVSTSIFSPAKSLNLMKEAGTLALVIGVLGQIIGLFSAMMAIESAGGVSMEVLAAGIKVSTITTLYGFLVFVISRLASLIIQATAKSE